MKNKLIAFGLLFCMLFISIATYSIPTGCTKMDIRGKQVYIMPDIHHDKRILPSQTAHINQVLSIWIEQLFREEGKTLFILEKSDEPYIQDNDTIQFLVDMNKQYPRDGKVQFKCADRRIEKIDIFREFTNGLLENVKCSFEPLGIESTVESFQDAEALIGIKEKQIGNFREMYFSKIFRGRLRPIFVSVIRADSHKYDLFSSTTVAQFLDAFVNVKREVIDNLRCCVDPRQATLLQEYLRALEERENCLRQFVSAENPNTPFYEALFNVIEKSKSFSGYDCLCYRISFTLVKFIADYGFYMDITKAIEDPMVKRIVLCAGGVHTENVGRLLSETYRGGLRIIDEVGEGISVPVTLDTIERLRILTPEELSRTLGLSSVPVPPPSPLPQSQQAPALHQCAKCGRQEGAPDQFQRCGRCKQVFYCSRDCQRGHWSVHKKICK